MGKLKDDIKELVEAGIIDWKTGDNISNYYQKKPKNSNRLLLAFGILAAILVGLGIILIIAHNWDNLNRQGKTSFAFLPLLSSLGLVGYTLARRNSSKVWKEVSSLLLFFSVAAAIALIGQIYHIEGDTRGFKLIWLVLALPIIYLLPSSTVSLLVLLGLTGLSTLDGSGWLNSEGPLIPYDQLLLFILVLPYYFHLSRTKHRGNFTLFHHWILTFVLCAMLLPSLIGQGIAGIGVLMTFFAGLYGIGKLDYFANQGLRRNPAMLVGVLGTVFTLFCASFFNFWNYWEKTSRNFEFNLQYDFIIVILFLGAVYLFIKAFKNDSLKNLSPVYYSFLVFVAISILSRYNTISALILTNLLLGGIGLYYILYGNRVQRLAILNFGMLIIAAIILARFFEIDISFVVRGACFVVIGLAFFAANYFLIRKSDNS